MTVGYGRRAVPLDEVDLALLMSDEETVIVRPMGDQEAMFSMIRAGAECPASRDAVLEYEEGDPGAGCPLCGAPPALHPWQRVNGR